MVSPLIGIRDTIVTIVEGITPYDDADTPYRYFRDTDGRSFGDGVEFHRAFRFEWLGNEIQHDFGNALSIEEQRIEMILRLNNLTGPGSIFDHLINEGITIKRTIDEYLNWPAGTDFVWCSTCVPRRLDGPSPNYDLVFGIVVRTQEF